MDYVKQHFVPKRYLQRFAKLKTSSKNDKYYIGVRRIEKGKVRIYPKSTEDIACLDNLYDDIKQSDPKHWEHLFSKEYEPLYGKPIEQIISKTVLMQDGFRILSFADKMLLGQLIAIQFLRMPDFLAKMQTKGKNIGLRIAKDANHRFGNRLTSKERTAIDKLCLSDTSIKSTLLSLITDKSRISDYAKIVARNVMNVIYNNTPIPFCTSDNPIILYNVSNDSYQYGAGGIARSDTTILFPLSPKVLIQVFYHALFQDDYDNCDGQRVIIDENDIGYVIKVNDLQMQHAQYESYYPPDFLDKIKLL